jgi:long-chain fatty acid transport protein
MSIATRVVVAGVLFGVLVAPSQARATTEVPAVADARSIALGGTGVAYLHNPTAVYLDPASLDGVQKLSMTADFSPMIITGHAPLQSGPTGGPQQTNLQTTFAPFFLVGAAYRVQERVTVALAAFPAFGAGGTYSNVAPGHDLSSSISTLEAAPAVSVRLLDNLAIGASYRISYSTFGLSEPSAAAPPAPAGTLLQNKMSLDGVNFAGFAAGIYYRPVEDVELGFNYRSKITTTLTGQLTATPPSPGAAQSFNASGDFSNPHSFASDRHFGCWTVV